LRTIAFRPRAIAAIHVRTLLASALTGLGLLAATLRTITTLSTFIRAPVANALEPLDECIRPLEFVAVDDAIAICIEPRKERTRHVAIFRVGLGLSAALAFFTTLTFLAARAAVARRIGRAGWLIFLGAQRPDRERERHGGEQSWDRFHSGF
jgi:hypothetical protein